MVKLQLVKYKKFNKQLILFIGLFCCFTNLYSQSTNRLKVLDSLKLVLKSQEDEYLKRPRKVYQLQDTQRVYTLNKLANELNNRGIVEEVEEYVDEALNISRIIKFKKGEIDAHLNLGVFYLNHSEFDKSIIEFTQALNLAKRKGFKQETANAYHYLAIVQSIQADYSNAIKNNLSALLIRESLGDKKAIANSYNNLGKIYTQLENHNEALSYHNKAFVIRKELGDKRGLQNSYTNFGHIYFKKDDFDNALKSYQDALDISMDLNDQVETANLNMNIGNIYNIKQDIEKAQIYYSNAQKSFKKNGNKMGQMQCYINISNLNYNQYEVAKLYIDSAIYLAKEIGAVSNLRDAYKILVESDTLNDEWKSAFFNHCQYFLYRDSLINEEVNENIIEAELQYDFDKKALASQKQIELKALQFEYQKKQAAAKSEREKQELVFEQKIKEQKIDFDYRQKITKIELEKRQQEMLNAVLGKENILMLQNARNEWYIRWLMLIVLIVLIAFGVNFKRNLNRQKTDNAKITQQKEDLKALINELNHRVKNNFQTVVSMLRIQSRSIQDEKLKDILSQTSNRFLAISNVHEKLYQTEAFSEINVKEYLNEIALGISRQFLSQNQTFNFSIKDDINLKLNVETIIPIALIVNELITNSFKYGTQIGKPLEVKIEFEQLETEFFQFTYSDNGPGLPDNFEELKSFGSTLVKLFAQQLRGKINFSNNNGVSISLIFRKI